MTSTEKILEEFEKLRIISVTVSDVDDDTYIHDEGPEYIKAFLITSIAQAIAEERERVLVDYTDFLLKYGYVDSDVYTEEPKAVERYLSSRDKPLTDKE